MMAASIAPPRATWVTTAPPTAPPPTRRCATPAWSRSATAVTPCRWGQGARSARRPALCATWCMRSSSSSSSRSRTRNRHRPSTPRITPRGHTASHARHVTHDTDTEHGTRFPGWGITKDPFSQPPISCKTEGDSVHEMFDKQKC